MIGLDPPMRVIVVFLLASATALADPRDKLVPPAPATVALELVAGGEQIYACANGRWQYKSAEAQLLDLTGKPIGKQVGRTWQADDGSRLTGKPIANAEATRVNAIEWVLFSTKSTGTGVFAGMKFVRRHNTVAGRDLPETCKAGEEHRAQFAASYDFYK